MRFAPLPLAAALGAVLLGGCTNPGAPLPTDFAQEPQQKIQAVRQWQTVAASLAERLSVMMIRDNSCTPQAALCDVLYVHPAANAGFGHYPTGLLAVADKMAARIVFVRSRSFSG